MGRPLYGCCCIGLVASSSSVFSFVGGALLNVLLFVWGCGKNEYVECGFECTNQSLIYWVLVLQAYEGVFLNI